LQQGSERCQKEIAGLGVPVYDSKLHFDTSAALRQKGNFALAERILGDKGAIWPGYISEGIDSVLKAGTKRLCRMLTFEIWMRQLNDENFRKRCLAGMN